jgi:hypothetical protein
MMSDSSDQPYSCERCIDAAAYVLGALEDHEVPSFHEHLVDCAICRAEIAQLQSVADSLAVGVAPMVVPEELRGRIMATVHAEAELLNAAGHGADRPERARSRWRWRWVPTVAAAGSLAVGILVGALAFNTGGGSRQPTRVVQALVVSPGHQATAALRTSGSHMELQVSGLPAPPPGRIYEVWLEKGTQAPVPTDALFSVTGQGKGTVLVPNGLRGVSEVLVTDEPIGGSLKPTRSPVIVARV